MKYEAYFLVLCINYVYDYLQSASINDKWENYGYAKYKNMFSSLSPPAPSSNSKTSEMLLMFSIFAFINYALCNSRTVNTYQYQMM